MQQVVEVTVVYDGQCLLCRTFTRLFELDPKRGRLKLIDARQHIPDKISAAGLDIDQGMIVMIQGRVYHGADALHAVALLTGQSDLFNRIMFHVFGSKALSHFIYPALRCYREVYLWITGKQKINVTQQQNSHD